MLGDHVHNASECDHYCGGHAPNYIMLIVMVGALIHALGTFKTLEDMFMCLVSMLIIVVLCRVR
jgi:hypothetical protein